MMQGGQAFNDLLFGRRAPVYIPFDLMVADEDRTGIVVDGMGFSRR